MTARPNECAPFEVAEDRKLMTYDDVAELFGVTTRTVRNWMRIGLLPPVRIGGIVRFRSRDVDALVEPTT